MNTPTTTSPANVTSPDPIAHALAWLADMADLSNAGDRLAVETLKAAVRSARTVSLILGPALISPGYETVSHATWYGPEFVTVDEGHTHRLSSGDWVEVWADNRAAENGVVFITGKDRYPHTVPVARLGQLISLKFGEVI